MTFQFGDDQDTGMTEMNLIPLIDIMLVLMIIFLVTATVANPSIPLSLPKTNAETTPTPPKVITVSINAQGQIAWNKEMVSLQELQQRFDQEGHAQQKPTVQLRADQDTRYDYVAKVMASASQAGLSDLTFMTEH